jgi:hypothetical protein
MGDWAVCALRGAGCAIEYGYPQSEIDQQMDILAGWWREPAPFDPTRQPDTRREK